MKKRKSRNISCPNENCQYYGKKYAMNLVVEATYRVYNGKVVRRVFRCDCGCSFSETCGTFFYKRKKEPQKYMQILECVVNQVGIRNIARILYNSKDTVSEFIMSAGSKIKEWVENTEIILPQGNIEYDEFWTFVGTKHSSDETKGEIWVWVAFHRENRFMIHFITGKHTAENAYELIEQTKEMITHPSNHNTDGLICYKDTFSKVYSEYISFPEVDSKNQLCLPFFRSDKELQYGQVQKTRKGNKIESVDKKVIFGNMNKKEISTNGIERHNLTTRQCTARVSRKTMKYSKELPFLEAVLWIFYFYYNFIKPHKSLRREIPKDKRVGREVWEKRTPAMEAGICNRILDWIVPLQEKSGFG